MLLFLKSKLKAQCGYTQMGDTLHVNICVSHLIFGSRTATSLDIRPLPLSTTTDTSQVFQSRRHDVFGNIGQMLLHPHRMQGLVMPQNFQVVRVVLKEILQNKPHQTKQKLI